MEKLHGKPLLSGLSGIFKWSVLKANLLIFVFVSVLVSLIGEKLPRRLYSYKRSLFRVRGWEDGGRIYEKLFNVKKWKGRLPELSDVLHSRFSKKHLRALTHDYLVEFLVESCKAEFTHWMIILVSFLFVLWADIAIMFRVVLLANLLNLPYIIIQRYNRPRIIRLLKKSEEEGYGSMPFSNQPTLT